MKKSGRWTVWALTGIVALIAQVTALPAMAASGGGRVINIASTAALKG